MQFSVELRPRSQPTQLWLLPDQDLYPVLPDQQQLLPLVSAWLGSFPALSQLQTAWGTDWLQWRFSFADQPFMLQFEHYTESFWVEADTSSAVMLLSELACCLQQQPNANQHCR